MPDEQKKMLPINYTATEFEGIRRELLQVAERFYPDTFRDFSDASFGAMMVDAVAYVGDQLSFYLDYNVNETFLDTAYQYNNVLRHGKILGYKHSGPASSYGTAAIFVMVPASTTGLGPDTRYLPILKRGSRFNTNSGIVFTLTENIDFSNPKYPVVVARSDNETGAPTHYAVKAYGNVVSGNFNVKRIKINDYERFLRIKLKAANVQEIISVLDDQSNEYYEVDYLSQDIVFKEISNKNFKNDNVPSILKPMLVTRKFVVERTKNSTFLQFGSGKQGESNVAANPQSVAINLFGKDYVTDTTFDPTKLSKNENFGIVPSNTVLTITYRSLSVDNSNVAVGKLNGIVSVSTDYADRNNLSTDKIAELERSFEVTNEEPITGQTRSPSSGEVKRRIYDTFPTQNRAVTKADYESVVYRMPAKFGSVKRCSVQKDPDSMKRNLNMYIISEDNFGLLTKSNSAIKNNLKTWLDNYRMINDTIDILDAHIFNFGVEFTVSSQSGANRFSLLNACVTQINRMFSDGFFIGEAIAVSDIYSELKKVTGVLDVNFVKIVNRSGTRYSNVVLNINQNTSPDGTTIIIPSNVVAELKFPRTDVKGKVI
tara:strand:+ start:18261 stop:20057 length:1797 start_codon:yes stop_codon:yes gene_type:complete